MRHGYRTTAGSVLTAAVLTATLAGCGGNTAGSGQASATPAGAAPSGSVAVVPSAAPSLTPSAAPSVALREPHVLVFSATGTAAVISVTYELDGRRTTRRSVKLPWRTVAEVPADGKRHRWSLAMTTRAGHVELLGIFDGAVVGRARVGVSGNGTGNPSVGGSLRG